MTPWTIEKGTHFVVILNGGGYLAVNGGRAKKPVDISFFRTLKSASKNIGQAKDFSETSTEFCAEW